ncbi:MAG: ROK family protein [Prevotella sp.]|nr:ROK family protein [Prevotella sp.]
MQNTSNIKRRVVGVDISNARTTIAIVDVRGNIIAHSYFDTSDYLDINLFVAKLTEEIMMLAEENGGYENIRSIGISAPSASVITGCIENAANLPWKGMIPLQAMMRDRLGLAVALGNDAHSSALGEKMYGSAHGMKNFIVISLGVGLGSCFFSEGHSHEGVNGYAGEFGHTCLIDQGRECGCGRKGCLEAYVAAAGIFQTAQEVMEQSDEPSFMRQAEQLTPRVIKEFCDAGDALAIETFRRTGYMLGIGLANYAAIVNPEAIIFTGGVSHAGHWLFDPLCESFESHIFGNMRGKVKILVSELNDRERDVLGASALAWEVPEYSLFK